jgi:NAD-dependent SIR2 family protein deacetylase
MPVPASTLELLHRDSIKHRGKIEQAARCSCFHCKTSFPTGEITDWVDDQTTALCPRCGIDSVVPGELAPATLDAMQAYWFERSVFLPVHPRAWQALRWRLEPVLRRVAWFWRTRVQGGAS